MDLTQRQKALLSEGLCPWSDECALTPADVAGLSPNARWGFCSYYQRLVRAENGEVEVIQL